MLLERLASPGLADPTDLTTTTTQTDYVTDVTQIIETPPAQPPNPNELLDDIFGSDSEPEPDSQDPATQLHHNQTSDQPRRERHLNLDTPALRTLHRKAGYRDGITAAKGEFVQVGFDEGFELGAEVGGVVGGLLGGLRALVGVVRRGEGRAFVVMTGKGEDEVGREGDGEVKSISADGLVGGGASEAKGTEGGGGGGGGDLLAAVGSLLSLAERELSLESIFTKEHFDEDGLWRYEVPKEAKGETFGFRDVALAHPLVMKWMAISRQLGDKFGVAST